MLKSDETEFDAVLFEQNRIVENLTPIDTSDINQSILLHREKSDLSTLIEAQEKSDTSNSFEKYSLSPSPTKEKEDEIEKVVFVKKIIRNVSPRKDTFRLNKVTPRGRGTFSYRPTSKFAPIKKKNPALYGESSTADMLLSANKVEIKDLQSQISFLQSQIKEVRVENKTLKNIQARQQRELQRIQEGKSDIPSLLKSHKNELKSVESTLIATRSELKECQKDIKSRTDDVMRKEVQIRELHALLKQKDRVLEHKDETNAMSVATLTDKMTSLENELEEKKMLYTQLKNQFYRSPYRSAVESLFSKHTHVTVATQTSNSDFDCLSFSQTGSSELDCSATEELKVLSKGDSVEDDDGPSKAANDKSRTSITSLGKSPEVRKAKTSSQSVKQSPVKPKKKVDFKSAPYSARYEAPKMAPKVIAPSSRPAAVAKVVAPTFSSRTSVPAPSFKAEIFAKEPPKPSFAGGGLPSIGGFSDAASTRYFNDVPARAARDMSKYESLMSKYNLSNPIQPPSLEPPADESTPPRFGGW